MGSSIVKKLHDVGLVNPPRFVPINMHYEVITGSVAYGMSGDTSDMDVVGFCIPPKDMVFPHLRGEIEGFGRHKKRFENWQEHHVMHKDKEYDMTVYSIVKFFSLCMEMNPNMVDCLFVPDNCIIHSTQVGQMLRDNRHMFLSKACWPKFKGYAYSQLKKMKNKNPELGSKRAALIDKFGYDTKFASHVVRLIGEVQQILTLGDLNLQQDRERLKAIRRGEWTQEQIEEFFTRMEQELETAYNESKLPWGPDESKIKKLLLECLEHHYGSLEKAISVPGKELQALEEISELCHKALGR